MYDFLLDFNYNYVYLAPFIDYFPKFKEVTWSWPHVLRDYLSIQRL